MSFRDRLFMGPALSFLHINDIPDMNRPEIMSKLSLFVDVIALLARDTVSDSPFGNFSDTHRFWTSG
jgi:hypothetical protein